MSYLAIARKWRPQRFDEVVGQPHVTRTLQNAIRLDRVHHAFLFTGARGVGKTSCARILAKALNCEQGPAPEPCGVCQSCKEIAQGSSPDVIEIDGASNNRVDEIRSLRENARYLPSRGRKKIYIIDEVHMLTESAFNALLKTLEEPPDHIVFLMATTEPQKIPETIQSRTLRFDFKRMGTRHIIEHLGKIAAAEGFVVSESALSLIAREAEGSMRDSQSLLDQVMAFAGPKGDGEGTERGADDAQVIEILGLIDRQLLFDLLEGVLRGRPGQCLEVVERVFSFGYDLKQLARDLLEAIRHVSVFQAAENAARFVDLSQQESEGYRALAQDVSADVLSRLFSLLLEEYEGIKGSESPRYHLEMTLLRMSQVRPVEPMDRLVERLAGLESRLLAGGFKGGGAGGSGGGEGGRSGGDTGSDEPRGRRGTSDRGGDSASDRGASDRGASDRGGYSASDRGGENPAPYDDEPPPRGQPSPRARRGSNPSEAPSRSLNAAWKGTPTTPRSAASGPADAAPEVVMPDFPVEPPPAGGEPGAPGPGRTYRDFLEQMDRNNPRFQTLIRGVCLHEERGLLRVAFPSESPVILQAAQRYAADEALLGSLRAFFGGPMALEVVPLAPEERSDRLSLFEELQAETEARRRTLRVALLEDPAVRLAMQLFELGEGDVRFDIKLGPKGQRSAPREAS